MADENSSYIQFSLYTLQKVKLISDGLWPENDLLSLLVPKKHNSVLPHF
jgi:hypothetical protein